MSVVGIGIDVVELTRAAELLARFGDRALTRFLTDRERAYVESRTDPVPHFAARVAAKEAVYKALQSLPGTRGVGWREMEVSRDLHGRPSVALSGLAAAAAALCGDVEIHLSLTHTHTSASAVAVLERRQG